MKKILLASLLLTIWVQAFSQVTAGFIYTDYYDINPDTLLHYVVTPFSNQIYDINMFGDANIDLEFTARGAVSSGGSDAYIKITSLNPNLYISQGRLDSVYIPGESTWNVTKVAKVIGTGDTINTLDAVWDNSELYLTDHSGHSGGNKNVNDWVGGEKYIGLKYMDINGFAYGWIKVQCPNQDSCYVKDYSFTPVINSVNDLAAVDMAIYPNPIQNYFYLKNSSEIIFKAANLNFTDMFGKGIKFRYEIENNKIKIEPDPALPPGCYFLQFNSGKYLTAEKILKIE